MHAVGSNSLETTYILFELPYLEQYRTDIIFQKKLINYRDVSDELPLARITLSAL